MPRIIDGIVYLGIDPGQSGGIAPIYNPRKLKSIFSRPIKMPATERDVWDYFKGFSVLPVVQAVIESVHSMPGQGVSSTFKFGMGYGGLRMALIAAGISFEEVTPQRWQKALSITPRKKTESKTEFKNRLRSKAQQLFPKIKMTLAIADALLIAEYCRRKHEGLLEWPHTRSVRGYYNER